MIAQLVTYFTIPSLKSKSEFSRKHFLRKSCLANFKIKVLLKNFIQRAFFSYSITFSRVQTDISINFCFCFCFYSFGRKNKSLNYAKFLLIAFKGRERAYLSYYSRNPLKSQLLRSQKLHILVRSLKKLGQHPGKNFHKGA